MTLPRFVAIKSENHNKYLRYVHEDGEMRGLLEFSGDELLTPYTKFEVEPAQSEDGLVHLKCCYNNKYLVKFSPDHDGIFGTADEPEEDQSKSSCTLFKPVHHGDGDEQTVQFLPVQHGHRPRSAEVPNANTRSLLVSEAANEPVKDSSSEVYRVIDLTSRVVFPKYVTFIGPNNKYLLANVVGFSFKGTDVGDPAAAFEIINNPDGTVRIKCCHLENGFWVCIHKLVDLRSIIPDGTNKDDEGIFSFTPVKIDKDVVALRNKAKGLYCGSVVWQGTCYLGVTTSSITNDAKLKVAEPILRRRIHNIRYRVGEHRIYSRSQMAVTTKTSTNRGETTNKANIHFTHTDDRTWTWTSTNSWKVGISVTLEAEIPKIIKAGIEISGEYSESYEWGETTSKKFELGSSYEYDVLPMTKVDVTVIALMGKCDVPFSYTQTDLLCTGEEKSYEMDDGLYRGANSFEFNYDVVETKLITK